jgi:hypothetical protein
MSSGSGTNAGDITANNANSTNTTAHDTHAYHASSHVEIDGSVFNGRTTFGTPLCFVIRWDIAYGWHLVGNTTENYFSRESKQVQTREDLEKLGGWSRRKGKFKFDWLLIPPATVATVDWSTLSPHLSFVDQDSHRSANLPLDQNAPEFPWITKDIDFMKWESDEKSQALWLSGPRDGMKEVSSQAIYNAKENAIQSNGCILYFFCATAGEARGSIATVFAHTLLHQIVCFSGAGDQITTAFLTSLLEGHSQRSLSGFEKDDPLDTTVKKILAVPDEDLHIALVKAIAIAKLENLSLIIDGINIAVPKGNVFVRNVSILVDYMIEARTTRFKALLTSPQHSDLRGLLGHLPSIEFDRERNGCLSVIPLSKQELISLEPRMSSFSSRTRRYTIWQDHPRAWRFARVVMAECRISQLGAIDDFETSIRRREAW